MTLLQYSAAAILLITLTGIAIGRYPGLRMNRATISLVGAVALLLIGAISREEAYRSIDFDTIALIFAMMIINVNLRVAGFFQFITVKVIRLAKTPSQLLALTVFAAGILSALFLNDTICIIFTPLIIEITVALRRNPVPYLMAVAVSSNIGSTATIIGNPQNMLIGIASKIPFIQFSAALLPVSLGGLLIAIVIIMLVYKREFDSGRLEVEEEIKPKIYKPLFIKSIIASIVMILLCLANIPVAVAALCAASILLVTRRLKPQRVFIELDWSLLVFFCGLFVITGAMSSSGISSFLFGLLGAGNTGSIPALTAASSVLSNLISNVPAVMLFKTFLPASFHNDSFWLTLAMATTLAGNMTLLGSVANLIVAESAKQKGIKISFSEYLKAGLPIALTTLIWGAFWLMISGH